MPSDDADEPLVPVEPGAEAEETDGADEAGTAEESGELDAPSPDGLDLARAAARAAGQLPGAPAKKQRRSGDTGFSRRRGRSKYSGAHPDDRDPQPLDFTLDRLVKHRGWETDLKVQGVFGRWAQLVGAEVADHCTPETLTDGKLVVRTDSTAWATQLRLLAPTLVRRLNEQLGHGTVLVIEVQGPHVPSWKKGPRSSKGRGPRDTYG